MGFGPHFVSQLDPEQLADPPVGRVCFEAHAHFRLQTPHGERAAILDSRLHDRYDRVVVGDWVVFDDRYDPVVVTRRLERVTALRRRDPGGFVQTVAANVDRVLICTSIGADLNLRRLERWLLIAAESEVEPVVVLTKADGDADVDEAVRFVSQVAGDHVVLPISAQEGRGLQPLIELLEPGRTVALLGTSGVGKSTLVNRLLDGDVQATGAIRAADGRGRHTTTARHLFRLDNGAWLLDNPGVRTVGILDHEGMASVFPEIEARLGGCRFRDCAHEREPGCAVREGVESGDITAERFAAWRKLQRELAHERRREDPAAARAERERWKRVHKAHRQRDAFRDKQR